MQPDIHIAPIGEVPWAVIHPLKEEDSVAAAALRMAVAPMKGKSEGIAGRGLFNDIMERVAVPEGGGIRSRDGWWDIRLVGI